MEFARTQLFAPLGIKWDLNTGANINHFTVRMQFLEGRVEIEIEEATGEVKGLRVRGQAAERP